MDAVVIDRSWEGRFGSALAGFEAGKYEEIRGDLQTLMDEAEAFEDHGMRRATVMSVLGDVDTRTRRFAEAEDMFGRVLKLQSDVMGFENPAVALTLFKLGEAYEGMGKLDLAEPAVRYAASILERLQPVYGNFALRVHVLRRLAAIRLTLGMPEACVEVLERALALADIDPKGTAEMRLVVLQSLAQVYMQINAHAKAIEALQRAVGMQEGDAKAQADLLSILAMLFIGTAALAEADDALRRAAEIYRAAGPESGPALVRSLRGLAGVQAMQEQWPGVEASFDEAEHLLAAAHGARSAEVAELLLQRGRLAATSNGAAALGHLARALDIREAVEGDSAATAEVLLAIGQLHLEAGHSEEALDHVQRCLAILDRIEAGDAERVDPLVVLGRARAASGDLAGAREALEQARDIAADGPRLDVDLRAVLLEELGNVYLAEDRLVDAAMAWESALSARASRSAPDHARRAKLLYRIAEVNIRTDRAVAATRNLRRAGRIVAESPSPDVALAGLIAWQLARVLESLDELSEVEKLYSEGLAFLEEALGATHPDVVQCREDAAAYRSRHPAT